MTILYVLMRLLPWWPAVAWPERGRGVGRAGGTRTRQTVAEATASRAQVEEERPGSTRVGAGQDAVDRGEGKDGERHVSRRRQFLCPIRRRTENVTRRR